MTARRAPLPTEPTRARNTPGQVLFASLVGTTIEFGILFFALTVPFGGLLAERGRRRALIAVTSPSAPWAWSSRRSSPRARPARS